MSAVVLAPVQVDYRNCHYPGHTWELPHPATSVVRKGERTVAICEDALGFALLHDWVLVERLR